LRSSSWEGKAGKSPLTPLYKRGIKGDFKKRGQILPRPPFQKEGDEEKEGEYQNRTIITSRRN
jgi:hypothetical protein